MKNIVLILFIVLVKMGFSQNWVVIDSTSVSTSFGSPFHIEIDKSDNSVWFGNNMEIYQLSEGTLLTGINYDSFISNMNDVEDFLVNDGVAYIIDQFEGLLKVESGNLTVLVPEIKSGYTMTIDSQDTIWVGSSSSFGVGYYGFKDGFYNSYTTANTNIITNIVYNVFEDSYNRKWITYQSFGGSGISMQDDTSWNFFSSGNSNLNTPTVRFARQDLNGNIWVGTMHGLYRYNEVLEDWVEYNKLNTNMPGEWIIDMEFDPDGRMWALFKDTALAYTYNYIDWTIFDESNSPMRNMTTVREMAIDTLGNLWLTGLYEIYGLNMNGLQGWAGQTQFEANNEIKIFPNPVSDVLNIVTYKPVDQIKIYDLNGKLLLEKQDPEMNEQMNISDLEPGIYLIQIEQNGNLTTERFVVK